MQWEAGENPALSRNGVRKRVRPRDKLFFFSPNTCSMMYCLALR